MNNKRQSNYTTRGLRLQEGELPAYSIEGLNAMAIRTQREVAMLLGITRQAVQQIERQALRKIRRRMYTEITEWRASL